MESAVPFPDSNFATKLDAIARETPERVYAKLILGHDRFEGIRAVTFGQLHRAVNRMSFWLDEVLGPSKDFDAFAFYTEPDIRYTMAVIAAVKTKRQAILVDAHTNPDGLVKTLDEFNCTRWLGSVDTLGIVSGLPEKKAGLELVTVPPLDYWLDEGADGGAAVANYPYDKPWAEALWDPVFVIQTSGSTGFPKSFVHSHAMNAVMNTLPWGPADDDGAPTGLLVDHMVGTTAFWLPRPWWLGGMAGLVHLPLFNGMTVMLGPDAPFPVTEAWVLDVLEHAAPAGRSVGDGGAMVDGVFMMPSMVRDLCLGERGLALLRSLRYLSWAGAALDRWAGDLLARHTVMIPFIGSTEMSALQLRDNANRDEWYYYRLDRRTGYRMDPFAAAEHGPDGAVTTPALFEMVLDRRPEWAAHQGVFVTFPHLDVYRTSDLYAAHPTDSGLWLFAGRADDLFKLKWQTRVRAAEIEAELERHPRISRAMVGGQGREEPFVIVELAAAQPNGAEKAGLLRDDIWAAVRDVNEKLLPEVKILPSHIIIADPARPLKRALKGTLNRHAINEAYKDDIERLYPDA